LREPDDEVAGVSSKRDLETVPTLYIVRRRRGGAGGAERVAERLERDFESNWAVRLLCAGDTFEGRHIPGTRGPPWWRSLRFLAAIDGLGLDRPDSVVLSMELGPRCDIYRAGDGIHRQNLRLRFGRSRRWMLNPWHWVAPLLEKRGMSSARFIVANSDYVRRAIVREYPQFAAKVEVVHNGFDPDVFHLPIEPPDVLRARLGLAAEALVLLFSGSGFERKGLADAVRIAAAASRLADPRPVRLVVCGRGQAGPYRALSESLGSGASFDFRGAVDNIGDYYRAADCMVLPTRNDPFSNSVLEALACGCPVVTTSNNGAAEVVADGETGVVVDWPVAEGDVVRAARFVVTGVRRSKAEIAASVGHLRGAETKAFESLFQRILSSKGGSRHEH
jgi:UDP-glucose:(heptosyl)LPS alpha-1,3-glucosyltransferase